MTDILTTFRKSAGPGVHLRSSILCALVALALSAPAHPAAAVQSGELAIPTPNSGSSYAAGGQPEACRVWFTEGRSGKIGCVSPDIFSIREIKLPTSNAKPFGIATWRDGAFMAEFGARKIATITNNLRLHEFALSGAYGSPLTIIAAASNGFWFSVFPPKGLGHIDESGKIKFTKLDPRYAPRNLAADPSGKYVWFIDSDGSRIGRIDTALNVRSYDLQARVKPAATSSGNSIAPAITVAEDGVVWFTAAYAGSVNGAAIGKLDSTGKVSYIKIPTANCEPADILWDGRGVWFSEHRASKIGFLDNAGSIREFATHTPHAGPIGLAEDVHGVIWVVEHDANKLGWLQLEPPRVIPNASQH